MYKIAMIGTGKLAHNLAAAFSGSEWKLMQVFGRNEEHARLFAEEFSVPYYSSSAETLDPSIDLVFIATNDSAIGEVANKIAGNVGKNSAVVHSSGSVPISVLAAFGENAGVLYALQTFTRSQYTDFRSVPIFVETKSGAADIVLKAANYLSGSVRELDSAGRQQLHLGAVFACNFPNLMWILAERILAKQNLPLDVYEPLVRKNVDNVFSLGANESLTGPAVRGDKETIKKHLEMLGAMPEVQEVYQLLSVLIEGISRK